MLLAPQDLANYSYCPILYQNRYRPKPLSLFEESLKQSIILAEAKALSKDTIVSRRLLIKAWDSVWWPTVAEKGIDATEAEKISVRAARKLTDYDKYDFSELPTIITSLPVEAQFSSVYLRSQIDILKLQGKSLVILDFSRKSIDSFGLSADLIALANYYLIAKDQRINTQYISIDLSEEKQLLRTTSVTFRLEDYLSAKRIIEYTIDGIKRNIILPRPWLCEDCKSCQRKNS